MSTFEAYRKADFQRVYDLGSSVSGYTPTFTVYSAVGGSSLLAVTTTANGNGSIITLSGTTFTILIKAADINSMPVNPYDATLAAGLAFDFTASNASSVVSKLDGGTFSVDPYGYPVTSINSTVQIAVSQTQYVGSAIVGNVVGTVNTNFIESAAATLTRPANTTAYSANDAVTDTGGSAITIAVSDTINMPISLERLRLSTSDTGPGTASASFEAYFFNTSPTPQTDNSGFSFTKTGYLGRMNGYFTLTNDGSFAELVPNFGSRIIAKPATGTKNIFVILKTLTAFTPSANSTTFNHIVEGFQGRA